MNTAGQHEMDGVKYDVVELKEIPNDQSEHIILNWGFDKWGIHFRVKIYIKRAEPKKIYF